MLLSRSLVRALIIFTIAVATLGLPPKAVRAAQEPPSPTTAQDRDAALLRLLETTLVDVDYDRVDFERIIQDLRERHNLNILVSWTALEAAGVRRDQRIEMRLKQISLATLLDLLLREAATNTQAADILTYHVESGVIVITTGARRRETAVLRVYDVADLLESGYAIRRFANTPVLGMELTGREFIGGEERREPSAGGRGGTGGGGGGMGGGGGSGGSIFGEPGEDLERGSRMERVQALVDLIIEHVDPASWNVSGGEEGSIAFHNTSFIIHHSLRTHQRIAEFLQTLRDSRPEPLNADVAIVRLRADKAAELRAAAGDHFPRLPAEALDRLALAAAAEGVLFRASTSGASGQRLWFSALTQREAVVNAIPVVADQASGYAPQSKTSTTGLELIVLPLVAPGAERMTLDVQMAWSPPALVQPRAVRLGPGEAEATIDQVQRSMRTVSSQTGLAVGETIALSVPQEVDAQNRPAEYEDFLIVRVRRPG